MNKDDFRSRLLELKTEEEVLNLFKEEEKNYFDI
jgi:mannitol/fructose-specific phosphotransferase system IIA component (Ntr-type)